MFHPHASGGAEAKCTNDEKASKRSRVKDISLPTISDNASFENVPEAITAIQRIYSTSSTEPPIHRHAVSYV